MLKVDYALSHNDPETDLLIEKINGLNDQQIERLHLHCKSLCAQINQKKIAQIEAEIEALQQKCLTLKGEDVTQERPRKKRQGNVIVNPNNLSEQYGGFGAKPSWLKELLLPAQGDKERLIVKILNQ